MSRTSGASKRSESRSNDAKPESELDVIRDILGVMDEVFWLRDLKEERVVYASPAFERLWGRSVESLLRSPKVWIESIHPEDRAAVLSAAVHDARIMADRKVYRILRPDGSIRRVEDRCYPIKNSRGEVIRLAGVVRDMTDSV